MTGLEPVTSSLPRTRSTTELHRLIIGRGLRPRTLPPSLAGTPKPRSDAARCACPRRQLPYDGVDPATAYRKLERETGIEPATNSLEGCDSTTELLPPSRLTRCALRRIGGQARVDQMSQQPACQL